MNCQSVAFNCNILKHKVMGLGLDQSSYSGFKTWFEMAGETEESGAWGGRKKAGGSEAGG